MHEQTALQDSDGMRRGAVEGWDVVGGGGGVGVECNRRSVCVCVWWCRRLFRNLFVMCHVYGVCCHGTEERM